MFEGKSCFSLLKNKAKPKQKNHSDEFNVRHFDRAKVFGIRNTSFPVERRRNENAPIEC